MLAVLDHPCRPVRSPLQVSLSRQKRGELSKNYTTEIPVNYYITVKIEQDLSNTCQLQKFQPQNRGKQGCKRRTDQPETIYFWMRFDKLIGITIWHPP